ncbi:MAG: cytochrome c-type biogenesis protein CcmH [Rhodobacteraceae bacterium]|jgi:cytochrome c-type biogenesis protein CcmH|nr:cytochrome c-type biogenesis protein CcmH [Paracoccaceae bacterium]
MNKLLDVCKILFVSICLISYPIITLSVESSEILSDPELEERARAISKNLRCLVCRNENIDDSNAELAKDLRLLVRERLAIGETNKEITNYVVSRYGEYVLLMPRFNWLNWFLWLCGPIMLISGFIVVIWSFKNKSRINDISLSEKERRRIKELLKD